MILFLIGRVHNTVSLDNTIRHNWARRAVPGVRPKETKTFLKKIKRLFSKFFLALKKYSIVSAIEANKIPRENKSKVLQITRNDGKNGSKIILNDWVKIKTI